MEVWFRSFSYIFLSFLDDLYVEPAVNQTQGVLHFKKKIDGSWSQRTPNLVSCKLFELHPWRLTWNLKTMVWKIIFLSKWVICRFHVNLPGCIVHTQVFCSGSISSNSSGSDRCEISEGFPNISVAFLVTVTGWWLKKDGAILLQTHILCILLFFSKYLGFFMFNRYLYINRPAWWNIVKAKMCMVQIGLEATTCFQDPVKHVSLEEY